jgi:hypothetical protein
MNKERRKRWERSIPAFLINNSSFHDLKIRNAEKDGSEAFLLSCLPYLNFLLV